MRKLATFAALTVCAGTALVGGASAASAGVNIGDPDQGTGTGTPAVGATDFANNWCGAPWLWSSSPAAQACGSQHSDSPAQ